MQREEELAAVLVQEAEPLPPQYFPPALLMMQHLQILQVVVVA